MSIEVSCQCGGRFRAKDEWAGRRAKCPKCGSPIVIPTPPPAQESSDDLLAQLGKMEQDSYAVAEAAAPPVPPPVTVITASGSSSRGSSSRGTSYAAAKAAAATVAAEPAPPRGIRDWLYLGLVLALLPLAWSTFASHDADKDLSDRFERTVAHASANVRASVERIKEQFEIDGPIPTGLLRHLPGRFYAQLPDDRIEGAYFGRDTTAHWVLAVLTAALFLGVGLLLLPADTTKPLHVFLTGLFTGTCGVLLLLLIQMIAGFMRGRVIIPRGLISGVIFGTLKLIQVSYDMADDPNSNFILSALGFTFGVGLCEEICKALPLLWHYRTRATLDWRGACLWGFLSGVGFGVSEAIMYSGRYYNGILGGDIYVVRFISCVALHGIWAAAAGIFIWKHQNLLQDAEEWYNVLFNSAVLVAAPMILHGLYDTLLKKDMSGYALLVALISFAWLVWQVEQARKRDEMPARAAYA